MGRRHPYDQLGFRLSDWFLVQDFRDMTRNWWQNWGNRRKSSSPVVDGLRLLLTAICVVLVSKGGRNFILEVATMTTEIWFETWT